MPAILELPEVRKRVSPLSVEEYHRLDEFNERGRRTELIRGILIEKMSKSPLHSFIAKAVYDLLFRLIPSGYVVRRKDPITLSDSEPEPHVAVVKGSHAGLVNSHPGTAELVVEVAVSSPDLDREHTSLYAEAGVKEYGIILDRERIVEVYRRPQSGQYEEKHTFGERETLQCSSLPGVHVEVVQLFPARSTF